MAILDNFSFFINEADVAVAIDCPVDAISSATWDEKNTLILKMENGVEYLLVNILPNIREIMTKVDFITVIFMQNREIKEACDVELKKDSNLNFEDNFKNEALDCYMALKNQE